jgi:hypothetical protein
MSQAAFSESFGPTIPLPTAEPPVVVEEVGSIGLLLKSPQSFARFVAEDRVDLQPSLILLSTSVGFYALYGLAMGCFASGNSLWQATLKTPLILLSTMAICAPSLYLLLCLSGVAASFRQVVAMVAGVAGLSSVVMVGFAPVAWLFGVSTSSVAFMVLFHTVVWCVALGCGLGLLSHTVPGGFRDCKSMVAWAAMLLIMCAQMATFYSPLLGVTVTKQFREGNRKFFFQHFYVSMVGETPGTPAEPLIPESAPALPTEPDKIPPISVTPMSN